MLLDVIKMLSKKVYLFLFFTCAVASIANAMDGGISLGGTRLIYPQGAKQASMPVINSTPNKRFLINSWVEDEQGKKIDSILVTPPMLVSEAKSENALRVVNTDANLAKDRESIFYLNVQAIPSVNPAELENKNVLQLAILSRIKIFVRPKNLSLRVDDAFSLINAMKLNQTLYLKNPTPYYVTLVNIKVDGEKQSNMMLAPFSETNLKQQGRTVSFQSINDYGAFSEPRQLDAK